MAKDTATNLALVAVIITAGIWGYDIARNKPGASREERLQIFLGLGLGATLLMLLAEFLPEIGGPLALLFLVAVAVGRPGAVNYIAKLTAQQSA